MYANKNNERESDSKSSFRTYSTKQGNVAKRLIVLLMMAICLVFAGASSAPIANAGGQCQLVCSEPYIDPADGQCYVTCCPADDRVKCPCERRLCDK